MEDNYVATLCEIINYDLEFDIYLFRPFKVVSDCKVDFDTNILTTSDGTTYKNMEDRNFIYSKDKIAYMYPMSLKDLSELTKLTNKEDIINDYSNKMENDIIFGVYDYKADRIKTILADKDCLVHMADEDWFYNFYFDKEYDDGEPFISISLKNYQKLKQAYLNKEYKKVDMFFDFLDKKSKNVIDADEASDKEFLELYGDDIDDKELDTEIESILDDENLVEPINKLNNMIGLNSIKNKVIEISATLKYLEKVKDYANIERPKLNIFMTGNPGTGKTTVAKIISEILYDVGYVKSKSFGNLSATDFIAKYVGQTGTKVRNIINKYKGGVIFIDEAYSFAAKGQEYGEEALAEIVNLMTKEDVTIIFAGYKDEMKKLIGLNSGLRSRITYYIDFKDYEVDELLEMYKNKIKNAKLNITDDALLEIKFIIKNAVKVDKFGNGRFIDKLFEKTYMKKALNTSNVLDPNILTTITIDDIEGIDIDELIYKDAERNEIGFKVKKYK